MTSSIIKKEAILTHDFIKLRDNMFGQTYQCSKCKIHMETVYNEVNDTLYQFINSNDSCNKIILENIIL